MRIYLMQHGEARLKEEDPERSLNEAGIRSTQAMAEALKSLGLAFPDIWQSGKRRAEQTARIVAASLGIEDRIQRRSGMDPKDPPEKIRAEVEEREKDLLLVGHLPHLSLLAGALLTGKSCEPIRFRNSGLVCLEREETGWKLLWILTPEVLPGR